MRNKRTDVINPDIIKAAIRTQQRTQDSRTGDQVDDPVTGHRRTGVTATGGLVQAVPDQNQVSCSAVLIPVDPPNRTTFLFVVPS